MQSESLQSTSSRVTTRKTSDRALRFITGIVLLLLCAQFLIGMLVNFFVEVPSVHPGTNAPNYFSGVFQGVLWVLGNAPLYLLLHAIVGLALFLGSLIILGLSIASRRGGWIVTAVLGLLGVVGAGFNGASFLNYGHDFSSLLMSVGFLLALMSYAVGVYFTR